MTRGKTVIILLKWIVSCVLEHNNITTNFSFLLIFCASKAIYGFHHELFYLRVLYAIKQKAIDNNYIIKMNRKLCHGAQ
jgi:hypothetical protein